MAKNKQLTESGDQAVNFTLDLINKKGKKRRQESIWTYLTDGSDVRYSLFRFHAPSDVKGTGFLSIEYPAKADDRWLFLPALGRSRRISANEKTDRFLLKDQYQVIKIDYFNKKGELSKTFFGKEIKEVAGSTSPKIHYMEMQNLETNHTSIIHFSDFKIDTGIATDAFSVRALEKI